MATSNLAAPDQLLLDIAEYAVGYQPRQEASYDAARLALADALACALQALDHAGCRRVIGPLAPGTIVPDGARVPGTADALDPAQATFSLAAMIRWLDYSDTCSGALTTHPSDNIGAVLMVADYVSRQRVSAGQAPLVMRDVFAALIVAYEIQGALGQLNDFRRYGIDQPLLTRVASAAVATRLFGGDDAQALSAVSNAFIDTSLSVVRNAPNIGPRKNWAAAHASADAVRLAQLAMRGEPGYPWVLSAPELGFHAARCQGEPLRFAAPLAEEIIGLCMFKFVPAGMHGQTAAECAFLLHEQLAGRVDDIESIAIRGHRALIRIMNKPGPLRNAADRDHCVQYLVALGLLQGHIAPEDFEDERAADPRIDALRATMTLTEDERYTRDFADPAQRSSANAVHVRLKDGTVLEAAVEYPAGHPRRRIAALPLLRAKLAASLERRFDPARRAAILDVFERGPELDRLAVPAFVDLFVHH